MIDKVQNESINEKENKNSSALTITDFDISKDRPIPQNVSLDYHTDDNSLFSIEIIIIPLIYYNPKDKKNTLGKSEKLINHLEIY